MSLLNRILKKRLAGFALVFLVLVTFSAIFAPWLAPQDPTKMNYTELLAPPSGQFLFGTDYSGRDIFSRVIYGSRITLRVSMLAVSLAAVLGVTVGLGAGFVGGWLDILIMRVIDIMMSIPSVLLAIVIIGAFGPGLNKVIVAIGIVSVPTYARLSRGSTLSVKEEDYIESARAIGCSTFRIVIKHVIPNIFTSLLTYSTLRLAVAIITTATLGFLGLGAQPPTPEWGTMLSEARNYLRDSWWMSTFPGLAITLTVLSLNVLGDALRDVLDPRMKNVNR